MPEALDAAPIVHSVIGAVDVRTSGSLALLATTIAGARAMSAPGLRASVSERYVAIGRTLSTLKRQPIRFWNFVPDPGERMAQDLDRYMVFNLGRYDGYSRWHNAADGFCRALPTASAVGITGGDLSIFCLASGVPGVPVENPRQRPAWQYSQRYGPMPPCFARATIAGVNGRRLLLVGGTASIVGEDSLHDGDADAQLEETLRNLEALVRAAGADDGSPTPLSRLIDLRVYVTREQNAAAVREVLAARCPRASRIEIAIARVCRPELLVEIEGVAAL